jgi:hypothetical protein
MCDLKIIFDDPNEQQKIFIFKNQGFIRTINNPPKGFDPLKMPDIWNLNLPLFIPKNSSDIENYPSNYR